MDTAGKDLSFFGHLDELRSRLIKAVVAVVICSCIFYVFIDAILAAIIKPVGQLVFTSPTDAFFSRMILTLFGGFFLSLPFILYHIWAFVSIGLTQKERKHVMFFGPFSFLLFVAGGVFAYFIVIPISLRFLLSFSSRLLVPMIAIDKYITFVGMLILAGGIIFELPLVLVFLTKIGIATPEFLRQKRKHAIVLILIVSAILTPPDVITQILLSVPLIVLYEIGIFFSRLTLKNKEK